MTLSQKRTCATFLIGLVLLLFPTRPAASAPPEGWPLDRAIYEVNLEYFPNHSLNELAALMPRLQKLGINTIYLIPIWEKVGDAQYLIIDYYKIDPRYGTPEDLKTLTKAAHEHGIRILLDFVTSLVYDGSYIFKEHPEWILRDEKGNKQRYYPFPDWGWALDCTNPEVIEYYTKIARHYVEEFDIDGWRIDSPLNNYDPAKISADHSRLKIIRSVKAAVNEAKPDALLVCEVSGPTFLWGDDDANEVPLFDEVCEASYNYEICGFMGGNPKDGFHYMVFDGSPAHGKWKLTLFEKVVHNQATSREFVDAVNGQSILHNRIRANFIENHDTERVSHAFPKQHPPMFVLIATMPGVPVVHAGQEMGDATPPGHGGERKGQSAVLKWNDGNREIEELYRKVLEIRRNNPALLRGEFRDVWKAGDPAIAFLRHHEGNIVLVALNFDAKAAHSTLELPLAEAGLKPEGEYSVRDELKGQTSTHKGEDLRSLSIDLEPYGYRILIVKVN